MPAIPLLDLGFLETETDQAHMHFGALLLFEKPAAATDHVAGLMASWLQHDQVQAPFNYVPVRDLESGLLLPRWSARGAVALGEHVHQLRVPGAGSYEDLLLLVEDLHGSRLKHDRPLWDIYLIDGLGSARFAVFAKVHHSIFDGHGGMRLFERMLSTDRTAPAQTPFWAQAAAPPPQPEQSLASRAADALGGWQAGVEGLLRNVVEGNRHVWRWLRDPGQVSPPAFSEPPSILNGTLSARRRVCHVSLSLAVLERVGKALEASVNDVLLGICGGAVRKYLQEHHALPRRSLTALVPVSLRDHAATSRDHAATSRDHAATSLAGNRLTFVPMSLATDVAEHTERIAAIRDGARDAKARLAVLGEVGAAQYGVLVNAVAAATQIFGLPFYLATPANLVVTNLIGPSGPRYVAGGRLHGIYAHAPMANGVGLNVAMVSYAGSACIGLTADPGIVDDLDGLASCLHDVADSLATPDHHSTLSSTQALIR